MQKLSQGISTKIKSKLLLKTFAVSIVIIVFILSAFFILKNFQLKMYLSIALSFGLISAIFGCILGFFAESFHRFVLYETGTITGGVSGFILGLCYIAIFIKAINSIKLKEGFRGYGVSLGMLILAICSLIVSIILTIISEENSIRIIVTLPVGILLGSILGLIGGWIMKRYYAIKAEE